MNVQSILKTTDSDILNAVVASISVHDVESNNHWWKNYTVLELINWLRDSMEEKISMNKDLQRKQWMPQNTTPTPEVATDEETYAWNETDYTHPNWMSASKYYSGNICIKNEAWDIISWTFTEKELLSLWFIEEIDVYEKCAERILWNYWSVYCDNNIKDLSVQLRKYFPKAS